MFEVQRHLSSLRASVRSDESRIDPKFISYTITIIESRYQNLNFFKLNFSLPTILFLSVYQFSKRVERKNTCMHAYKRILQFISEWNPLPIAREKITLSLVKVAELSWAEPKWYDKIRYLWSRTTRVEMSLLWHLSSLNGSDRDWTLKKLFCYSSCDRMCHSIGKCGCNLVCGIERNDTEVLFS